VSWSLGGSIRSPKFNIRRSKFEIWSDFLARYATYATAIGQPRHFVRTSSREWSRPEGPAQKGEKMEKTGVKKKSRKPSGPTDN
jgi:hypothetical protein